MISIKETNNFLKTIESTQHIVKRLKKVIVYEFNNTSIKELEK